MRLCFVILFLLTLLSNSAVAQDIKPSYQVIWSVDGQKLISPGLWSYDFSTQSSQEISDEIAGYSSPDGTKVIVSPDEFTTVIVDTKTSKVLFAIDDLLMFSNWSVDSKRIVGLTNAARNITVYEPESGKVLFDIASNTDGYSSADSNPDTTKMAVVGIRGQLSLVDLVEGTITPVSSISQATRVKWDYQGQYVAVAEGNQVRLIDDTGETQGLLIAKIDFITSLEWSQDDSRLFAATSKGEIVVWSIPDGRELEIITGFPYIWSFSLSPYGGQLAVATGNNPIVSENLSSTMQSAAPLSQKYERKKGSQSISEFVSILVPAPSLDLLDSIQAACVPTKPPAALPTTDDLAIYIKAVKTDASIPPACAADLIAVAEALLASDR